MRRTLFIVASLALGLHGATAESSGGRSKATPNEATVTAAGKVVPAPSSVEKLAESGPSRADSACLASNAMTPTAARELVLKIAQEENFYPEFVLAVAHAESQFDVNAVSPKGAIGLMQLEPATAERYRVKICDPAGNVRGGIRFLRELHAKYRNPLFILAAYNAGETALAEARGVPPFPETVRFVANVLNEFYEWPPAAAKNATVAGGAHDRRAPMVDARQKSPDGAPQDDRWQSGFVWNVE